MPGILTRLRRITAQQDKLAAERDRLIAEALRSGHTGSEVAEVTDLTKSRVHQIARAERDRQRRRA